MKKVISCFFTSSLLLLIVVSAYSYDNEYVHQNINVTSVLQSNNFYNTMKKLGFEASKPEKLLEIYIANKKIKKWFEEGAKLEDETHCRSKFHFHDPLKPWDRAGLSNTFVDTYCLDYRHRSSLVWAQDADNLWTWQKARQYYFEALTSANEELREKKFADTFRALGQIMHLIADSSIPAHVRNDIHVFPVTVPRTNIDAGKPNFESWAKINSRNLPYTGIQIDQSIFNRAVNSTLATAPITALWDQDKYSGSNLEAAMENSIGMAEYTNANFFSEDTIFKDYPHPALTDTNCSNIDWKNPEEVDAEDGKLDNRIYISKTVGEQVQRLASVSYVSYDIFKKRFYHFSPFVLDDKVYEDYAQKLIPRAVGYSAGLLNYFFRGNIDMVPDEITGSGYVIVNNTDEDMNGAFELWYDNKNDERVKAWSSYLTIGNKSSGNNKSTNITFTPPTDAKEGKYMLVFRGNLGVERDAVAGQMEMHPGKIEFNGGYIKTSIHIEENSLDDCSNVECCWSGISVPNEAKIFSVRNEDQIITYYKPPTYLTQECASAQAYAEITVFDPECRSCKVNNLGGYEPVCWNLSEGLRMEGGSLTKATTCGEITGHCFSLPYIRQVTTTVSSSSLNYKLDCAGAGNHLLYIKAAVSIEAHELPSGEEFLVNGIPPINVNQHKITYHECGRTYLWQGILEWSIPLGTTCVESMDLIPSVRGGLGRAKIKEVAIY